MVNIYQSVYDEQSNLINGRTKLFIKESLEDGSIGNHDYGIACTPSETGTLLIVDDWIIPQIDKVQFIDGKLSVKDGASLEEPVKSEKQLRMEELQRQMAELQAMPDEPSDIEEQTDAPLLDYTEQPTE